MNADAAASSVPRGLWWTRIVTLAVPAVIVAAVYLAPFAADPDRMPFGRDTSRYVWRIELVQEFGVDRLTSILEPGAKTLAERSGYLAVASVLSSITGRDAFSLMWVLPAALSTALALAVVGFALSATREPAPLAGAIGVAVAASAFVAWTAVGYATNLALDTVAFATATASVLVGAGRRGRAALVLLLAGGALIHWAFAIAVLGIVVGWAIWRTVIARDGEPWFGPRTRSLVGTIGVAAVGVAISIFVIVPAPPTKLPTIPADVSGRIAERLPSMAPAITFALAAIAAIVSFWITRDRIRRSGIAMLSVWLLAALAGVLAWSIGVSSAPPPYRTVGFALAAPALLALGALTARRWLVDRPSWILRALGSLLVVAVVGSLVAIGAGVWGRQRSASTTEERAQLSTLASYLEPLPADATIAVVLPRGRGGAPANPIRSGIPAARLPWTEVLRTPIGGTAEEPRLRHVEPTPDVVVVLTAFAHETPPFGDELGPGVWLVRGPDPTAFRFGNPPRAPGPVTLGSLTIAVVLILGVAGAGWCRGLLQLEGTATVSLAPAFGLPVLAILGTVGSRLGIPLSSWGAVLIFAVSSGLGWLIPLPRRRSDVAADQAANATAT